MGNADARVTAAEIYHNGVFVGAYPPCSNDEESMRWAVGLLQENGVAVLRSCQGGLGHDFHESTIDFRGGAGEGLRVLGLCLTHQLSVLEIRRTWRIHDREPLTAVWQLILHFQGGHQYEEYARAVRALRKAEAAPPTLSRASVAASRSSRTRRTPARGDRPPR